jgi:hypothetical protein
MHRFICSVFIYLLFTVLAIGQEINKPTQPNSSLEEILEKSASASVDYYMKFRDLIGEERRYIEEFSKGELKLKKEIVCDMIIYQSHIDSSRMVEYRNIKAIDGRPVSKAEDRVVKVFDRLAKSKSVDKELERIQKESQRFDEDIRFSGFTLNQAVVLAGNMRSSFKFERVGEERLNNAEVIVIKYLQIKKTLDFKIDISVPGQLKNADTFMQGRMWLDKSTFQLWKQETEFVINHPLLTRPQAFMKIESLYTDSQFNILTPKTIVLNLYTTFSKNKGDINFELSKRLRLEYTQFNRFDVNSTSDGIDQIVK